MSFPLNRPRRLRRQIKQHSVDALHLGGNSRGNLMQHRIGNLLDGRGHSVLGIHGADDGGPAFVALAVTDANALEIGHCHEVLPDVVQAVLVKLLAEDLRSVKRVGVYHTVYGLACADTVGVVRVCVVVKGLVIRPKHIHPEQSNPQEFLSVYFRLPF